MNERIFELMCKANISDIRSFHPIPITTKDVQKLFEKFAELIVQECAECVTTGTYDATPPYDVIIPVLLNELAKGMKKHFGVE